MENQLKLRLSGILLLINVSLTLQGQGLYVGAGTGYGWAFEESTVGSAGSASTNGTSGDHYTVNASFAEGIRGNLMVGYRLDSASFIELGIHSWKRNPISWQFLSYRSDPASTPYSLSNYTLHSNQLCFSLSYGLNYTISRNFSWYAKAGMIAGKSWIGGGTKTIRQDSSYLPIREYEYEYEYATRFSLGAIGGMGIQYRVSERIALSGEWFTQFMQTSIRSREVTLYKEDRVEKTNTLPEYIRHNEHYNGSQSGLSDLTDKNQSLNASQNAWGFNLGLVYSF